ncbi:MAG: SH3 domain-containing protein [Clostridia bacterium]|nr:SH3 domain-containing protein [Clostridia bacterium]
MIPVDHLIRYFQRMNVEGWRYTWGAAEEYNVDCSGAFVWAYRQEGEKIYHGSNRIARDYVIELLPISEAKPGMAAFKARRPGEDYYDLPSDYRAGGSRYNGDLNDYHHIGLVDDDPRYVLNAKSTADGFRRSSITENWDAVGYLKAVTYDDAEEPVMEKYGAIVTAPSGGTVRLRRMPTTDSETLAKVPVGSRVTVNEEASGWAQIEYNGTIGYMMSQYLAAVEVPGEEPSETVQIELPREAAEALYEALAKAGWG